MFPDAPEITVAIPAKTELLKMLVEMTKHVATISGFSSQEAQKIALAVDEAITNVIKHSYEDKELDDIQLDFFSTLEGIKIRILFSGLPPHPGIASLNLPHLIKQKKKGGLGVTLMRRIMDKVEYSVTADHKNCCEMIKWKEKN